MIKSVAKLMIIVTLVTSMSVNASDDHGAHSKPDPSKDYRLPLHTQTEQILFEADSEPDHCGTPRDEIPGFT